MTTVKQDEVKRIKARIAKADARIKKGGYKPDTGPSGQPETEEQRRERLVARLAELS